MMMAIRLWSREQYVLGDVLKELNSVDTALVQ